MPFLSIQGGLRFCRSPHFMYARYEYQLTGASRERALIAGIAQPKARVSIELVGRLSSITFLRALPWAVCLLALLAVFNHPFLLNLLSMDFGQGGLQGH